MSTLSIQRPDTFESQSECLSRRPSLRSRVLRIWQEPRASGQRVAEEILRDPVFAEKFRVAFALVVGRKRRDWHSCEDLQQEARLSIFSYLQRRGLTEYTDLGEAEFEGWLFQLCRRHIRWAVLHEDRKRAFPTCLSDLPECDGSHDVPEALYERALLATYDLLQTFSEPLKGVMEDDLAGLPCATSAQRHGISMSYVSILRSQGRTKLRAWLVSRLGEPIL
ncbi:MAG: hypothetical protein ACK4RK_19055 [Gemmataceae bacterium]